MSYNGGQGRITNELRNQKAEDALDLWLVEETTRYYYRMLAIKQIFENPQQYGFVIKPEHLYKPMEFKKVDVTSTIPDLVSFAREHGITYAHFIISRLCSITITLLPFSTSLLSTVNNTLISSKCSPVVGSSRTYMVLPVSVLASSVASFTR